MAECVVWIEGVDFFDTLDDTQKLSIIRGGFSHAHEMPDGAFAMREDEGLVLFAGLRSPHASVMSFDRRKIRWAARMATLAR